MRNIPILRAGFALSIVNTLAWPVMTTFLDWPHNTTVMIVMNGMGYAAQVALWIGCLELASRLHGRAARGAKLAAGAYALGLALSVLREVARMWIIPGSMDAFRTIYSVLGYVALGVALVTTVGFVVAAWHQRRAAIIGGSVAVFALAVVTFAPAFPFADHWKVIQHISSAAWIVRVLALLWLTHRALPGEAVPSIPLAARGLRWMSKALWWRLAASIGFALLSLMTLGGGTVQAFEIALVAQVALELVVLGAFGIGALAIARAALPESPRRTFVLGGLAAIWCAGVMVVKAPYLYFLAHGSNRFDDAVQYVYGLTLGEPLVAVAAIALVAIALRRVRELDALAELVSSRTLAFVCLMLASIGLASYGVEHADTAGNAIGMLVGACASLVATTLVAGLLGRAADTLDRRQPSLPTATVV